MHANYDTVILLVGTHTRGAFAPLAQRYILRVLTVGLLIEADPWKQPKHPSILTKHY